VNPFKHLIVYHPRLKVIRKEFQKGGDVKARWGAVFLSWLAAGEEIFAFT